ncbi:hypothetical protein BLX24_11255 [Arsenicibacter rosenii]|uniref:Glycosyl transferase n=1 Tax=Arsenicibacter rosenii TaxID=1750698 RepID=A0A1S2VK24_9BACT|nr:hypothetical protein BLX24_11255 [Arsenicibacter rosenii]
MPVDVRTDEPRRAVVALEMLLSGHYLTPTLNGALYFNKPPLYNWMIAGSFRLWGDFSSLALRFPMALSAIGFSLTIFWFVRRELGAYRAFLIAGMQLVNGRVLFFETLFGLMDITLAWITYTSWMLLYRLSVRQRWWVLYPATYLLTAIGFMMKGWPSVIFQGLTLVGWLGWRREWRRLWHPAHVAGLLLFAGLVGGYYVAAALEAGFPVAKALDVLWFESTRRTALTFGIGAALLHLLTFPFEFIYHFAPFTLLLPLLAVRGAPDRLRAHPFLAFNGLVFLVNIPIYWASPQVYARYLLMFLPLLFTCLVYLYEGVGRRAGSGERGVWVRRWVERIWGGLMALIAVGALGLPFLPDMQGIPYRFTWAAGASVVLGGCWYAYTRLPAHRLLILLFYLLFGRIAFNALVLPPRLAKRAFYKATSEQAARLTLDPRGRPLPLYVYRQTITPELGATDVNTFHIEVVRRQILPLTSQKHPNALYLADSVSLLNEHYQTLGTLMLYDNHPAKIVKFVNERLSD